MWVASLEMYIRDIIVAMGLKDSMYLQSVHFQCPTYQLYEPGVNTYNIKLDF